MITIKIDGFTGKPSSLVSWEYTATGIVIRLCGPCADAINSEKR